jgi:hypothetical protein
MSVYESSPRNARICSLRVMLSSPDGCGVGRGGLLAGRALLRLGSCTGSAVPQNGYLGFGALSLDRHITPMSIAAGLLSGRRENSNWIAS